MTHHATKNALGHGYEAWATGRLGPFIESPEGSRCVASFDYFQEALDYRDYGNSRGTRIVVRCLHTRSVAGA